MIHKKIFKDVLNKTEIIITQPTMKEFYDSASVCYIVWHKTFFNMPISKGEGDPEASINGKLKEYNFK